MRKDIEFKLNLSGLNTLMKSGEMQSCLNSAANQIAGNAGAGFEVESAHPIRFIAIASVRATSKAAGKKDLKNNTLLKALGSVKI